MPAEVSLVNLLNNKALYAWGGDDITKKVIAISPTVFTNNEAFQKSLLVQLMYYLNNILTYELY